ncbi:hypothetical protein SEA_RENNA12_32 [Arthrobacter phage Renna12]|nr:hypothetical protein SEA_RENNA12_32 [Arthrobacter phage Renna12]
MTSWTSHADYADKMKAEIRALIADGTIPEEVGSFSELHDYIDANMLAHELVPPVDLDDETAAYAHNEEWARKFNAASDMVNEWLRNGGHQIVTVTITAEWPRAEWLKFLADHADPADVADSFAARLDEVFSQNEVLTGVEVLKVKAE